MAGEANPRLARTAVRFGERLTGRGEIARSAATSGPGILWVTLFLLVPLAGIGVLSFLTRGSYGQIQLPWTLDNYRRIAGFGLLGFDSQYPQILLRSLLLGAGTTAVCLLASLPLAFFIAPDDATLRRAFEADLPNDAFAPAPMPRDFFPLPEDPAAERRPDDFAAAALPPRDLPDAADLPDPPARPDDLRAFCAM
jgi:hypothetical protein